MQEEEKVYFVDLSFVNIIQILHIYKGTGIAQGWSTCLASIRFWVQVSAPAIKHNKQSAQSACNNFTAQKEIMIKEVIASSLLSEGHSITVEHSAMTSQAAAADTRPSQRGQGCAKTGLSPASADG